MTMPLGEEAELFEQYEALVALGAPMDLVRAYSRTFAKYSLLRAAQTLERGSAFSAARAVRDRVEDM